MSFWRSLPRPILGLSPMDGVTDVVFRHMVASHGKPDVFYTEFTHVHDVCRGPEFLLDSLMYSELERPIVAQLYGKDPELFYQAAHAVCELGFDGLDVNMGCPSRNVASSGSGAGLIKTPDLARNVMRAARRGIEDWASGQSLESAGIKPAKAEAIRRLNEGRRTVSTIDRRPIPLSVKTRLGYDDVIVDRWIEHLLLEHPAVISLHGRTLQQMYRGEADWRAIARAAEVVRGADTLLFGNGDVQSLAEAARRVREAGVDGVLIGRAALGAPWFFCEKEAARRASRAIDADSLPELQPWVPALPVRFDIMLEHARCFERQRGADRFRRMRKHLGWYCKGFSRAAALRAAMFQVSSVADVEAALSAYHARTLAARSGSLDVLADETAVEDTASLASRCG